MSKTVSITKENISRTRGHVGDNITQVDIQFTLIGQAREVEDGFIKHLDKFVSDFNDALDPNKELRVAAGQIAQTHCEDEPIRPEVSK